MNIADDDPRNEKINDYLDVNSHVDAQLASMVSLLDTLAMESEMTNYYFSVSRGKQNPPALLPYFGCFRQGFWKDISSVTPEQGFTLVMGYDPHELKRNQIAMVKKESSEIYLFDEHEAHALHMTIYSAVSEGRLKIQHPKENSATPKELFEEGFVNLTAFIEWVKNTYWFKSLGKDWTEHLKGMLAAKSEVLVEGDKTATGGSGPTSESATQATKEGAQAMPPVTFEEMLAVKAPKQSEGHIKKYFQARALQRNGKTRKEIVGILFPDSNIMESSIRSVDTYLRHARELEKKALAVRPDTP